MITHLSLKGKVSERMLPLYFLLRQSCFEFSLFSLDSHYLGIVNFTIIIIINNTMSASSSPLFVVVLTHILGLSENVIYLVQCNRCNLQYIGETKRQLKDRFNEYRRAVDKTSIKSKPSTVSEHFLSHSNHSYADMQLIPLEKIHSSRDSVLKARESNLIDKAMTLEPHGLNHREELL